jgi:ABC-type uncharacterized transport system substrate-binding protein
MRIFLTATLGLIFAAVLGAAPALAHPHVWVTARAAVVFDKQGQVAAIRHAWVFDEMYSAFVTQGIGKDGQLATKEDLAPLAKTNVESLAEFDYFTHAKAAGRAVEFGAPIDYTLEERPDKLVVLTFTLPLKTPMNTGRAFTFQVYDPTYFVAFSLEDKDPVAMTAAPSGCSASVLGANPLVAEDKQRLALAAIDNFSPGADFSVKLASRIIVACP